MPPLPQGLSVFRMQAFFRRKNLFKKLQTYRTDRQKIYEAKPRKPAADMTSTWTLPPELDCVLPRSVVRQHSKDIPLLWRGVIPLYMFFFITGGAFLGACLSFHHLEKHGLVTPATIENAYPVKHRNRRHRYWRCDISYSFVTPNGATIHGKDSTPLVHDCRQKIGKIISVRYLRETPEKNISASSFAVSKRTAVHLFVVLTGLTVYVTLTTACVSFLFSLKEKRLLMWGVPTAGTISKTYIFKRKDGPHLTIWCRYARQNGRIKTVRRTFSLYGHTDKGASILQKFGTNTTVLYDPARPWLAALYPLEIFRVQESPASHPLPMTAEKTDPVS
ncbi:hypothetical protein LWC05_15555 [Acetobacter sicerae]|uniref:DUF3592 domain-containing protein n=1 Tax=Acetobacter sicerae TaxID=85325 RepID=A0ABS8VWD8_9PROT|nr:DUF3592 domain-containing protein [Acetobacter sicerae]MCE0745292.1 hypothetical protein [Acetobacter sicerae]